jgi:hypothetical protein
MSKYARKKDTKHPQIVEYLKNHGLMVEDLSAVGRVPDLLVGRAGQMAFVEIKSQYEKGNHRQASYTRDQLKWLAGSHGLNVYVAKSGEEAVRKFRQREFISAKAKDELAVMLGFADGKETFTPSEIEPILNK